MLIITIKQGKEKSLLERQLHIYASAIERVDGKPGERMQSGATAVVQTSSGHFLARAGFSPTSQIRARVWSFDPNEPVDHAFIKRRVKAAVAKHTATAAKPATARPLRLIRGEEDGLPGLTVDWHAGGPGFLICQFLAAGVDAWKIPIVQTLMAETGCPNVYEQSDALMRKAEALPDVSGALAGDEPPPDLLARATPAPVAPAPPARRPPDAQSGTGAMKKPPAGPNKTKTASHAGQKRR